MKKLLVYILFIITNFTWATQFTPVKTSNYMTINIEKTITVFGVDSNYVLGAFVKRGNILFCVGIVGNVRKMPSFSMQVYGKDANVDGANEGEELFFAVYNIKYRCEIGLELIDKNNLKIPVFFQTGKEVSVYSWQEKNYEWKYPSAIYCQNYTEYIIPQAPERPFNSIPKYTSSRDLFLNVSTGDVFSKYSKPKKYTVYFELITGKEGEKTQKYCITKDSFEITIIDTNVINLDQYIQKISPSICKNKGEISIDTTQFPFSFASFLLQKGTQQTIISSPTTELEAGIYKITEFTDKNKCIHATDFSFKIDALGNCNDNYILTLFSENGPQQVFFEQSAQIKIVNQRGDVIQQLTAPAYWDGKNKSGQYVDMGIYFIYENNQYKSILNVYR